MYDEYGFERRLRVSRAIFNKIENALMVEHSFVQYKYCTGKQGIHPLEKLVALFRFLAYGDAYDREDENLRLTYAAFRPIVREFAKLIKKHFGRRYLNRCSTRAEKSSISNVTTVEGFPDCLGS